MTGANPPEDARAFAREALAGLTDKAGDPLVAHAERMAERVEGMAAKQVAYLHDVCEDSDVSAEDLRRRFPEEVVVAVIDLTRMPGERYFDYIQRVAGAGGLALTIKRADIQDHLDHRQHIPASLARRYERAQAVLLRTHPAPVTPAPEAG